MTIERELDGNQHQSESDDKMAFTSSTVTSTRKQQSYIITYGSQIAIRPIRWSDFVVDGFKESA